MFKEALRLAIKQEVKRLYGADINPQIDYPNPEFGDLSTNVAFQLASELKKSPEAIAAELQPGIKARELERTEVAGSGFINFWLKTSLLSGILDDEIGFDQPLKTKTVVVEYSDPNPFKQLHAGHLYTSIVGDAISNLLEALGARVYRVNFGGDVGLHVAKAMWGILRTLGGEDISKLTGVDEHERAAWLARAYIEGTLAYEQNSQTKLVIEKLNQRIYQIQASQDKATPLAQIYWTTRQWSYDYFESFYKQIGSHFDRYYPESTVAPLGVETVRAQLKRGIFEPSDGAVVFRGEQYGLHTRVFITSQGLPTYEAKDLGLALTKERDYRPNLSIIITGNDIAEYMKVVMTAVNRFAPEVAEHTHHLTHGLVSLKGEGKMSSRKGNVLAAMAIIEAARAANQRLNQSSDEQIALAAVKYSFLRQNLGPNIVFDPAESVSLQGDSGVYLQYTVVRARSVLAKVSSESKGFKSNLTAEERQILLELSRFGEIVREAAMTYSPHIVANYLYKLAQVFNLFYQGTRIVGSDAQAFRLRLTEAVAKVLDKGLELINITVPAKM